MNQIFTLMKWNIPIFVGALSGVFLTSGFTLIGWVIFIVAALLQQSLLMKGRED